MTLELMKTKYICKSCGGVTFVKERYERHIKLAHPKKI